MSWRVGVAFLVLMFLASLAVGGEPAAKTPPEAEKPQTSKESEEPDDDYELQKLLVDTLDQVERNYVKPISRRELIEAAIRGVLRELDPYSNYIDPEDMPRFRVAIESQFGGVGIQVGTDNGQLKVISPIVGTPAYRAGVLAGDRIVEIDGASTRGLLIDEVVKRMKGEPGTSVKLGIIHVGRAEKEEITLTREVIELDTVRGFDRNSDDSWNFLLDRDKGIGYICLTAFGRDTAGDLRKALAQLRQGGLRALILDLRFNPGGLLNSAVEVADLFVAEGRIVSTQGRTTAERVWNARKRGTFEGFPMAILVNRYSASASEIVAACLQDHHRATIVGERTWGKGSVQNVIEMEGGESALKLTTAGYRRPSGKNIDKRPGDSESDPWGVMPNQGFELRLRDEQMFALMEDRRQRDIVRPKTTAAAQAASSEVKGSEPEAEEAGQRPASAASGSSAEKGALEKESPREPGEKPEQKPKQRPQDKTTEKPKAKPGKAEFVDRQLDLAKQHLVQQLTHAEKQTAP